MRDHRDVQKEDGMQRRINKGRGCIADKCQHDLLELELFELKTKGSHPLC